MAEPTGDRADGPDEIERPAVPPPPDDQPDRPPPNTSGQETVPPDEAASEEQATAPPADPWAHRRGEPRVFALLWTIYLFVITAFVFFGALAGPSISPEVMRPAARMVILLTMAGICLLWPMVRLSQASDEHPLRGAVQDFIVVMIPAQALIWPQVLWWLARWPLPTVAAMAASAAAWGLFIAALLALHQASRADARATLRRPLKNLLWMGLFIVIAGGGLVASFLGVGTGSAGAASGTRSGAIDVGLMLSPLGSILELTRDISWTGRSTPLTPPHWVAIGLVGAAAAVIWALAAVRSRRGAVGLRFNT